MKLRSRPRRVRNPSRLREILAILHQEEVTKGINPPKLRQLLERLGPTFIKMGQILSMREDLLPRAYCEELAKLRSEVAPMPFGEVSRVLQQELGADKLRNLRIEETPLGSASIAQVHRARLAPDRRAVVVKVQRSGIVEKMAEDIRLLRRAAALLHIVNVGGDAVDLPAVINEMWAATQQELDFLSEARNLDHFARLHQGVAYTACPRVEWAYSTARVLVMEYIDGIRVDDVDALTEQGYDMNEIGVKLAASYAKQVMDDAFFHADPHPGNIFVRDGKIVWMDMGMMGSLSRRDQQQLSKAVAGVAAHDVAAVKEVVLTMGVVRGPINHSQLYNDLDLLLLRYADAELMELDLGDLLREFFDLAQTHNISMPPGVTMLMRGVMTLEGLLERCAPEISFMQVISAHLKGRMFDHFNLEKELLKHGKTLYQSGQHLLGLPIKVSELVNMLIKGQAKVNLELVGSDEPIKAAKIMVDKLVLALITAAILLSSALICTTDMQPRLLGIPALGLLGFLTALVMGVWFIWHYIRDKR